MTNKYMTAAQTIASHIARRSGRGHTTLVACALAGQEALSTLVEQDGNGPKGAVVILPSGGASKATEHHIKEILKDLGADTKSDGVAFLPLSQIKTLVGYDDAKHARFPILMDGEALRELLDGMADEYLSDMRHLMEQNGLLQARISALDTPSLPTRPK
jgi:hypothetical protein